jgi:hypothetical protein
MNNFYIFFSNLQLVSQIILVILFILGVRLIGKTFKFILTFWHSIDPLLKILNFLKFLLKDILPLEVKTWAGRLDIVIVFTFLIFTLCTAFKVSVELIFHDELNAGFLLTIILLLLTILSFYISISLLISMKKDEDKVN